MKDTKIPVFEYNVTGDGKSGECVSDDGSLDADLSAALYNAALYNANKRGYVEYADGDLRRDGLFAFEEMRHPWNYNDLVTWRAIDQKIRSAGNIRKVLDIGCGAGTWSFRIARAFPHISVMGMDISEGLIETAEAMRTDLFKDLSDRVEFHLGDACDINAQDSSYDLSICLHDVLNHIPGYDNAVSEMTRVSNHQVASVHPVHGAVTMFSVPPEQVKHWDRSGDWVGLTTLDNQTFKVYFHLFTGDEIRAAFEKYAHVSDVIGADICVSDMLHKLRGIDPNVQFNGNLRSLDQFEGQFSSEMPYIDYAKHIIVLSERYDLHK